MKRNSLNKNVFQMKSAQTKNDALLKKNASPKSDDSLRKPD